jgi:hypothetical protein
MKSQPWIYATAACAFALAGAALAAGFATTYTWPASGVVAVTNIQANAVWRPVVVAVRCADSSARTVTVSRVSSGAEYVISATAGTAQSFVYEFSTTYWFGRSNVLQVSVQPACTGSVEVIFE